MTRRHWVHVPAQYTGSEPAALMVFQDGWLQGDIRAGAVLDHLIERGEMPVTIGVFVDPDDDRNLEHDAFNDTYATFLLDELLPSVLEEHNVTDDPEEWAIGAGSSGEPPKPLRIFLPPPRAISTGGPGRMRVAAALAERDYDFRLAVTDDGHDLHRTRAVLPDALRWLWRS